VPHDFRNQAFRPSHQGQDPDQTALRVAVLVQQRGDRVVQSIAHRSRYILQETSKLGATTTHSSMEMYKGKYKMYYVATVKGRKHVILTSGRGAVDSSSRAISSRDPRSSTSLKSLFRGYLPVWFCWVFWYSCALLNGEADPLPYPPPPPLLSPYRLGELG
jgi:hypothetical protein